MRYTAREDKVCIGPRNDMVPVMRLTLQPPPFGPDAPA